MLRNLTLAIGCGLLALSLSGCGLLRAGCGVGYGGCYDGFGYYDAGYGSCVSPCCDQGPQFIGPVHRARLMRQQRLRNRGLAGGRRARQGRDFCGVAGYGCCPDVCGFDTCMDGSCGGTMIDGGFGGMMTGFGPTSSGGCNCGKNHSASFPGGMAEGGWVESPHQTYQITPAPAEPKEMPPSPPSVQPMSATGTHFYAPPHGTVTPAAANMTSGQWTSQHKPTTHTGSGSPIQPVLWAPSGI